MMRRDLNRSEYLNFILTVVQDSVNNFEARGHKNEIQSSQY